MKNKIIGLKVYVKLKQDLQLNRVGNTIAYLVNDTLCSDEKYKALHCSNRFKNYSLSTFRDRIEGNIFVKGNEYSFNIKTPDRELLLFLLENLEDTKSEYFDVTYVDIFTENLPQKISKLKLVTPCIGSLERNYSSEEFINNINLNSVRKFNDFYKEDIPLTHEVFKKMALKKQDKIILKNKYIVLGNKGFIDVNEDDVSQRIARFIYEVGLGYKTSYAASGYLRMVWEDNL